MAPTTLSAAPLQQDFGNVLIGQARGLAVTVTNNTAMDETIDPTKTTTANNRIDFLPVPTGAAGSCLIFDNTGNIVGVLIPPMTQCILGILFLPTHFGQRGPTAVNIFDTLSVLQFTLTNTGSGVAGYRFAGAAAEYATFGFFPQPFDLGSNGMNLNAPVVGVSGTSDGGGIWLDATDGGVFTGGDAGFFGSMGAHHLNKPVVGMAGTPTDQGYWLVASDGGIFTFGDAPFAGSTGAMHLNKPVVGMASTPDGQGYWLVASDGGIFTFGDAEFLGSMGAHPLNKPVVGMASTPSGNGYWLVASDGGIFTFGDAGFFGSTGAMHLNRPIVGMAASPTSRGYWMVASDGGLFTFGDAPFEGSLPGAGANVTDVVGMAPTTAPLFEPFLSAPASRRNRASAVAAAVKRGRLHVGWASAAAVRR